MKQMETMTDAQILRGLVAERQSNLNPYTPFAKRLQAIYNALDRQIETEREAEKNTREILKMLIRCYERWNQRREGGEDDLHYAISQVKTLLAKVQAVPSC
jgi:hypothetical protein